MPTGRHLSKRGKAFASVAALLAIIVGVCVALGAFEAPKSEPAVTGTESTSTIAETVPFVAPPPTDIVKVAALDAIGAGRGQDELFLRERGEILTKLVLDEHSYCNMGSGGLPCMAMSSTYSMAFGGKRAMVDGNKVGDTIVVRRLRILDDNETPRTPEPGTVYIPWMQARILILGCETKSMIQTHEGLVFMTTKDSKRYTAVEPVIDEVFKVANEAGTKCGNIQLGTE